ncbi:sodium-coupled monocarboxylate transporter 1 isoform X2 [Rhagoletis pomonella]|uniref:sodium-coupled monocarboxylate transporter 1 isoform X2 n=1 Tax=Rhagoletis pomonella TaxID=28610 RepID=UPI0017801DFC|nr:sodium-coupled monocarboxylate transporter 1 isoform X2 [Rhagoletis pomonella]
MDRLESTLETLGTTNAPSTTTAHPMNVAELSSSLQHFGLVDYLVFVLMLAACAVIGFYFGFIEKKKKSGAEQRRGSEALDYLVGGRKMKVLPVALSLVASFVSGISLLGTSTEIYVYGTQYAFILITLVISGIISWYVFLPVFCNLQLTSTYEYFEMRFGRGVRYFGSVLFIVGMVLWLPVAVYVPALTFNQVSGIDIHIITPVVCLICTFYTCVGGLKAVIWTDVVQSFIIFIMYGSILAICIKGTIDVGGLDVVWKRNSESGRLNTPDWTWDPTVRLSMLAVFVGGSLHKIQSSAVNQICIQRYLSLPSFKKAKQTVILFNFLLIFLMLCCCYMGLLAYASYYDCDPLSTKLASASDQLPTLLVMKTVGDIPGLPGLFVSGVFSAALSSLSTGLNSLACVISQDVVASSLKTPLNERQTAVLLRLIVFVFGVACIGLVYVVEKLGMVLQLATMTGAVTMGPLLAVYTMGVVLPWINGKSALTGCLTGFLVLSWICTNAQIAQVKGEIAYPKMPVSIDGCDYEFDNETAWHIIHDYKPTTSDQRNLYHLSFLWYSAFGAIISIAVAAIATRIFGTTDLRELDPALVSPFMRRFLPVRQNKEYFSVSLEDFFNDKSTVEREQENSDKKKNARKKGH